MTAFTQVPSAAAVRLRQIPALVHPLTAAVRWQPLLAAAALGGVLLAVKADDLGENGAALAVLRGVAALLAVGAAFLLDDGATDTLAASPSTLAWRRHQRLVILTMLAGLPWALAVLMVRINGATPPVGGLTLELAAMLALALAAAAGIMRWAQTCEPGVLAVPVVLGVILAMNRLPERWALVVTPGPAWGEAHQRWAGLFALGVTVFALCNRDPARGRRRPTRR